MAAASPFTLKKNAAGGFAFRVFWASDPPVPQDISTWRFRAHLRSRPSSPVVQVELYTPGTIPVLDGPGGLAQLVFLPQQTRFLPAGRYVLDVFREVPQPRIEILSLDIILEEAITR